MPIGVAFKNCDTFTDCMSEINNTQINNVKHINILMPMYKLIEHNDNYSKTSGSLWQYFRDELALIHTGAIKNLHVANNKSVSFKFKQKVTRANGASGTKDVKIMVQLKYLSNSWRTL